MKVNFREAIGSSLKFSTRLNKFGVYFIFNVISAGLLLYPALKIYSVMKDVFLASPELMAGAETNPSLLMPYLGGITGSVIMIIFLGILFGLVNILLQTAFVDNYARGYKKKEPGLKKSINFALSKYLPVLAVTLILGIGAGLAGSIPIAGGIASLLISLALFFVIQEILLNKAGVVSSIKNSWTVFRENVIEVLVTFILTGITGFLIMAVFLVPATIMMSQGFLDSSILEAAAGTNVMITFIDTLLQNKSALVLSALLLLLGSSISRLFALGMKTNVWMQLKKK